MDQTTIQPPLLQLSEQEFRGITQAANAGDRNAIQRLRELLEESATLWQTVGDLATHAITALIGLITKGESVFRESLHKSMQKLRADLSRPNMSCLEELCLNRVLVAWLQMQLADQQTLEAAPDTALSRYWYQRQSQASRLFDQAVKSLSQLRKVNLAGETIAAWNGLKVFPTVEQQDHNVGQEMLQAQRFQKVACG